MLNKTLLFICVAAFMSNSALTQTKMIFHKSHSGTSWNFTPDGQGNRGEISPFPLSQTVIRINDSTIVFVSEFSDGSKGKDTLINDPYWNDLDSSNLSEKSGFQNIIYKDLTKQDTLQNVREKEKKRENPKRKS